jgi:hypothetical protein
LRYLNFELIHIRPIDEDGLSLITKGNVPDQPLTPRAQKVVDNLVELWWGPTATNGYPILRYLLEMRNVEDADFLVSKNETELGGITRSAILPHPQSPWKCIYNGSGANKYFKAYFFSVCIRRYVINRFFYFFIFVRSLLRGT